MYASGNMGKSIVLGALVVWLVASPAPAQAQGPLQLKQFEGRINIALGRVIPLEFRGEAPVLGKFSSIGEMVFVPGETPGTLLGQGVVVCKTDTGDTLVGVTRWNVSTAMGDYRQIDMQFAWRASIHLGDGTAVHSTGRFAHERPADMTAQGIIAILIGLLVPAVQ